MKFFVSLLALSAFAFTACNTLATRRTLYSPAKASGQYVDHLRYGTPLTQPQWVDRPALEDEEVEAAAPIPVTQ
ncbi:MAG: hypothetical protein ABI680_10515 [Chthoniobacteraceae bacterium]